MAMTPLVKSKVAAGNPDIVNFPTPNTIVGAGKSALQSPSIVSVSFAVELD